MNPVPVIYEDRVIGVIGMGYVGVTLAVGLADAGFQIYGVEKADAVLEQLRQMKPSFYEQDLEEHLIRHLKSGRIRVSRDIPADQGIRTYIVTVGTPVGPDKKIRLEPIMEVGRQLAGVLRDGNMVILRSTVKVGVTRHTVLPLLQASGASVDLAFCPERTVEGKALSELSSLPQIVSGLTEGACLRAARLFSFLTPTVIKVGSLETAELAKLVSNTIRDVNFAFSNEIALVCEQLNINMSEIIHATTLHYPRCSLSAPGPVGGPCLEKDPYILAESLEMHNLVPKLTLTGRKINEELPGRAAARIAEVLRAHTDDNRKGKGMARPVIAILGMAFKGSPETDDLRGSMAFPLIEAIRGQIPDAAFRIFDPVISPDKLAKLSLAGVQITDKLEAAFQDTHVAVIQNNHPVFQSMPLQNLAGSMAAPAIVYDFWNLFQGRSEEFRKFKYIALGARTEGEEQ
ncbi:nucleotide sugar dehydrogenase [Paenibacillus sp. HN-1]|uniref:nucleotide sugar dehydrogenase n=1 Tax=Paenibacillus TaxID=44249 RepID=UPI001CA8B0F1|nr:MULTISPECIES: nucleotide sugar dehydrogenase [Paenibacillus]MBY9078067.1 nucleotide sugar dehydrogenase [Paenibacillus sp. CGMCC 1.18879]MBY9083808.1 nucleotide sugar dehydrogenase [Paenibacillus sinensis]